MLCRIDGLGCQVCRARKESPADRADAGLNDVGCDWVRPHSANCHIDSLIDQIHLPVRRLQRNADLRMLGQERRHHFGQQQIRHRDGDTHSQLPGDRADSMLHGELRRSSLLHHGQAKTVELAPRLGQLQLAGVSL